MQLVSLIINCLTLTILVGFILGALFTKTENKEREFYLAQIQTLIDKHMSKNYTDYAQGKMIETPGPIEAEVPAGYGPDGLA